MATNQGTPAVLDPQSRAGKAFRDIARRMNGEEVPFESLEAKDGFFGRLSRLVRPGGA